MGSVSKKNVIVVDEHVLLEVMSSYLYIVIFSTLQTEYDRGSISR
jgi:hypothetical protein